MSVSRVADATTWLLSRANARAQALLAEAFGRFELRPAQYRMLAALEEHGEVSQAGLGRLLALDRKDVAVAVDALGDRGLVDRRPDPADRRRNIVALSARGRQLLPELHATLDTVQEQVVAPLTPEESARLRELLSRLAAVDDGRMAR